MKRLIVCEFADAEWTVPGSVFTHACAECKRLLMTAPSGQKMLQKYPEARLICRACYGPIRDTPHKLELAGTVEEIAQECVNARPNLRRQRN